MVTSVGQWWTETRKPSVEDVANHIAALAWMGLRHLRSGRRSRRSGDHGADGATVPGGAWRDTSRDPCDVRVPITLERRDAIEVTIDGRPFT